MSVFECDHEIIKLCFRTKGDMKILKAALILLAAGSSAYSMTGINQFQINASNFKSKTLGTEFLQNACYLENLYGSIFPNSSFEFLKGELISAKKIGSFEVFLKTLFEKIL